MKTRISNMLLIGSSVLMLTFYLVGCKKTEIALATTSDVNIVGYLDKHSDSFSLFRQILERTETSAFLNAYGAYTCFAVTNSGVKTYLSNIGAASVEAADLATLKGMVRLHLLEDTVTTSTFTDGRLPVVTMYGQYLITSVAQKYGVSNYLINRQGFVLQANIRTGNGIIHVIDNVLMPATLTLAKILESKPEYSIFTQAVKETGYYDLLNTNNNPDVNKRFLTLIAESNKALADSGIASYAALKAKYAQNANLTSDTNKLNMYVAYHILFGINFLGDIITSATHTTLAPQEVISTELVNQQVILNEVQFNGILERGVMLNRAASDIAATNGVLHDAAAHFTVKFRTPTAVYWDVSDFPEIRKLSAYFRKASYTWLKPTDADVPVKDITWPVNPANTGTSLMSYNYNTTNAYTIYASFNDMNKHPLGLPARPIYVDYKTPVIIKGKYKVWICYVQQLQSSSSQNENRVLIDGEPMQRTFNFVLARPSGNDGDLESINYKRYTENPDASTRRFAGRLVGVVDIKTTERHTLRIENIRGTQNDNNLDMVHFIPVGQIQYLPRFKTNGDTVMQ